MTLISYDIHITTDNGWTVEDLPAEFDASWENAEKSADAYGLMALTAAYADHESFAIVDPSDFCRACKGKGSTYSYEPSALPPYRMTDRYTPCWLCGGTGNRTVKVS